VSRRRPPATRDLAHQPREAVRPQRDLHAVEAHIDALDQQLRDPRLRGGSGNLNRGYEWIVRATSA
jgi:hypothetical protein